MLCTSAVPPEALPDSVLCMLGPRGTHIACHGEGDEEALLQRGAIAAAAQAADALPKTVADARRVPRGRGVASPLPPPIDSVAAGGDAPESGGVSDGGDALMAHTDGPVRKDNLNAADLQEALRLQSAVRVLMCCALR